jgi:hypothetical protein
MRPIEHYSCGGIRQRAIRFDLPVLAFLLFAPVALVVLSGTIAHTQESQTRKMYRIGFLRAGQPPKTWVEGFRQGLRERGYVDGQNVVIEFGFTDGSLDQLPRLAEELLRSKVDVVVASAAPAALAVKKATTSDLDSCRVWDARRATSRDWPPRLLLSPGSASSCSRKLSPSSGESLSSGIRQIRRTRYSSETRRRRRTH